MNDSHGTRSLREIVRIIFQHWFMLLFIVLVGILFMLVSISEYLAAGKLSHEYYPLLFVFFALAGTQLITLAVFSDVQQKKLSRIERDVASLKKK